MRHLETGYLCEAFLPLMSFLNGEGASTLSCIWKEESGFIEKSQNLVRVPPLFPELEGFFSKEISVDTFPLTCRKGVGGILTASEIYWPS